MALWRCLPPNPDAMFDGQRVLSCLNHFLKIPSIAKESFYQKSLPHATPLLLPHPPRRGAGAPTEALHPYPFPISLAYYIKHPTTEFQSRFKRLEGSVHLLV